MIERPDRLIYLSSGMHRDGDSSLRRHRLARATFGTGFRPTAIPSSTSQRSSAAIAARWPDVRANVVDPGWVPTRMGGPHAPDDLTLGHTTQVWLATSDDPEAATSGGYWHHRHTERPAPAVQDSVFQQALLDELAQLTGLCARRNLKGFIPVPRSIATTTTVDRDGMLEFIRPRHHVTLVTTPASMDHHSSHPSPPGSTHTGGWSSPATRNGPRSSTHDATRSGPRCSSPTNGTGHGSTSADGSRFSTSPPPWNHSWTTTGRSPASTPTGTTTARP